MNAMPTAKRSRAARRAALAMHAKHGPEVTAAGRAAFEQKFIDAALAQHGGPENAEQGAVERTAAFLRRRYFAELAERSVQARQRRRAAK